MSIFSEIFQCCGKENKQKDITFNIVQRRRATTCESAKRKTYIKRSVGKNPVLDLSNKNSMNTTIITTLESPSMNNKYFSSQQSYFHGRSDYWGAGDEKEYELNEERSKDRKIANRRDYRNKDSKIVSKFINFKDEKQVKNDMQYGDMQNTFNGHYSSYSPYRVAIPRIHVDKRTSGRGISEQKIVQVIPTSNHQNRISINRKITKPCALLQTIEERLSLPSCSQSQNHSIQQNNSKTTLTFINDKEQNGLQSTPQTAKYQSCIVQAQKNQSKSIKLTNSYQIGGFQQKYSKQYQTLICSKMEIDIEIYNNQLKSLIDQHNLLLSEKDFSRKKFEKSMKQIQTIKTQLEYRIKLRESQLQQIKQKKQF